MKFPPILRFFDVCGAPIFWVLGSAACCFSIAYESVFFPTYVQDYARLDRQVAELQRRYDSEKARAASIRPPEVLMRLDGSTKLNLLANDIHARATQNSLEISDATFRPATSKEGDRVGAIEIGVRLTGSYPSMKRLIGGLLGAHQGLALESLSVRRNNAAMAVSEIDLRLTYFFRK